MKKKQIDPKIQEVILDASSEISKEWNPKTLFGKIVKFISIKIFPILLSKVK